MKLARMLCFLVLVAPAFAQQKFGEIGNLKLVSGDILRECRVGYRTFGQPDVWLFGEWRLS